jgi:Uma2 family endonuclease
MSASANPRLTEEEYLKIEREARHKSEFYDGQMYAMSGASWVHGLITTNLSRELGNRLLNLDCSVIAHDIRVRVSRRGFYTYPDVVVVCGPPAFVDNEHDTLLNPTLLIEVLSPSTEQHDRGFKLRHCRQLESLQEYLLVAQAEPYVQSYRRQPSGDWLLSEWSGLEATCRLTSVECELAMAEVYRRVKFGNEAVQV